MNKYIGIDLHSNNSVVVISDEEDRIVFQKRLANKLDEILLALPPHKEENIGVVVESACGTDHHFMMPYVPPPFIMHFL
jgi:transposase